MLPKHIDRPTRISYFRSQVVLTRFFSKQGVKFNFLRQNKYAKSRPIINYKRHNVVNTHTSSLQIMLQSPQKNNTRSLPTSFRTLVRRYIDIHTTNCLNATSRLRRRLTITPERVTNATQKTDDE